MHNLSSSSNMKTFLIGKKKKKIKDKGWKGGGELRENNDHELIQG